jgi:glyceraldehyde 3-phosphate dehydrogenase
MSVKLGINGFGRIGRLVFRAALSHPEIEVVAVNDLTDSATMAHLLKYDSVQGMLDRPVAAKDDVIEVDSKPVAITSIKDPAMLRWKEFGVDIVAECTGLFRDREGAEKHLTAGARKVIISAPAKDPDITIVLGVNSNRYDPRQHNIVSNASCTTNCLAPVAKVLLENFGIRNDLRRARAAALSMIPTTTGAARAVALVLPELAGRLNGLAIRVPTPNVSIVDFVATVDKTGVTVSDVNEALKKASEQALQGILGYSEIPLVSSDYNGSRYSSIVDAPTTRMADLAALIGSQL